MRIGLLWHSYYSGNLGVSALSDANMTLIKEAAGSEPVTFVLFGPRGGGGFQPPEEFSDAEYIEASSFKRAPYILKRLRECDFVFDIGAGDSFADTYGAKRFTKIAGLKFLAALAGSPAVLSPQTIGPFKGKVARKIGATAMSVSKHVFARDGLSHDRATEMMGASAETKLSLTTDVAFALQRYEDWPENFPKLEDGKKHIGVNVSGLLYKGGYTGGNQFGLTLDYKKLVDTMLEEFSKRDDLVVWLIPHVYQIDRPAMEGDREVAKEIAESNPNLHLAPLFYNAREAKTFIAGMDLVLAARMHVTIAAVSSGTACLPMSYSIKFQGLFGSLEYPYTLDMKSEDDAAALTKCLQSIDKIDEMTTSAASAAAEAKNRLRPYTEFLANYLSKKG